MRSITIGTRGSKLAVIQAEWVLANFREVVPELKQYQVNSKRIAKISLNALRNEDYRASVREALLKIKKDLGEPGVSLRCAKRVLDYLETKS